MIPYSQNIRGIYAYHKCPQVSVHITQKFFSTILLKQKRVQAIRHENQDLNTKLELCTTES